MTGTGQPPGASTPQSSTVMEVGVRGLLAIAMLVGFFVVAVGLALGLLGATIWLFTSGHGGAGAVKLGLVGLVVVAALVSAMRTALRTRVEPSGVPVDRAGQPELWRTIDELAAVAGTRGPDDVRVVPVVNAAVWEDSKLLGLRGGRRYLELGLPLLAGLTVAELRAVLAHELGHFGRGHTKVSALTYRAKTALEHTLAHLEGNLLAYPLRWYAKAYAAVAASANRAQELNADAASVTAAGRAAAQNALRKIGTLDVAWSRYVKGYLGLAAQAERTPEVLLGFRSFLADPTRGRELAELERKIIDDESRSVFDSHPPTRVRVAAMDRLADPGRYPDDRPAWMLLRDPAISVAALEGELLKDNLGPRGDWPEIIRRAGAAQAERAAGELARVGMRSGAAPAGTVDEALAALHRGELLRLAHPAVNPALAAERVPEASRTIVTELLAGAAVADLVRQGRASFELNWGVQWRVRLSDGSELDAESLVAPAVADPRAVLSVRDRLLAMGVTLAARVAPGTDPPADLKGLLTAVRSEGNQFTLLVCDTGLLLVPHQLAKGNVETLVRLPIEQLRQWTGTRWLDTTVIASAAMKRQSSGVRLVLRARDGGELKLRTTSASKELGEAYSAIGRMLGARLSS